MRALSIRPYSHELPGRLSKVIAQKVGVFSYKQKYYAPNKVNNSISKSIKNREGVMQ
jgi:hypothetical protein